METLSIGYARVSSKIQNITLEEQKEKIKQFASEQGYTLLSCCFSEGSANETLNNENFVGLLKIIINHFDLMEPIRYLLVSDISRLSRNVDEFKSIKSLLDSFGVTIIAIDNPLASYSNQLEMVQKGETERESNNEKTKLGIARKREDGLHQGKIPYGYERKEGKLAIFQKKADQVKKMYRMILNGKSYSEISREIPDFSKKNISDRVRNPFYCGKIRTMDGQLYEGQHIPLISQEEFNKAQMIIDGKKSDQSQRKIITIKQLEGIVFCPVCKKALLLKKTNGNAMSFYCEKSNHLTDRKKNIARLFTVIAKRIYGFHEIEYKIEKYCENIEKVFRQVIRENTLEKINTYNVHVIGRLFSKKYGEKIINLFKSTYKEHQENQSRQESLLKELNKLFNSEMVLKESLWDGLANLTHKIQKAELIKKQFTKGLYYTGNDLFPVTDKEGDAEPFFVKMTDVDSRKQIKHYDVFMKKFVHKYDMIAYKLGYLEAYYKRITKHKRSRLISKIAEKRKANP